MSVFELALKRCIRDKGTLVLLISLPVIVVTMPAADDAANFGWTQLPLGYQFFGIILLFTASKMVHFLLQDRASGVLVRISAAPISHFAYLSWNLLAYASVLVAQIAIAIGGGLLAGHEILSPALLFVTYVVFAFAAMSFALAWCSLFRSREASMLILVGVIMIMAMLGGLMWPVEIMPDALQRTAPLLPTYWLAEAQSIVVRGEININLILSYIILGLFTLVFLLLGSRSRIR